MTYRPSPRPAFSEPTAIRHDDVTRYVWGDEGSGQVTDWIYVSSERIHQLVFGLAPGRSFRSSDAFRTVFAADEVLVVLAGTLALANPQTGEVHRVRPGQAAFFRRDTWHHGFNAGSEPLRVLEYFAPPPAAGTSGSYAQQQPLLETFRYGQDEWLDAWPERRELARKAASITVLDERDLLWRLEGTGQEMLVGIWASTEHLTVGTATLPPGAWSGVTRHAGDKGIYVTEGSLAVRIEDGDQGRSWHELVPGDGFYLPGGTEHRLVNESGEQATFTFGVAPGYVAG